VFAALSGSTFVANISLMMTEVETEVQKWLRQQPEDFYAASFNALVKQWDKCINVGGGCFKI
jgi:N-dimethylarginine dimethylaminohydrolase